MSKSTASSDEQGRDPDLHRGDPLEQRALSAAVSKKYRARERPARSRRGDSQAPANRLLAAHLDGQLMPDRCPGAPSSASASERRSSGPARAHAAARPTPAGRAAHPARIRRIRRILAGHHPLHIRQPAPGELPDVRPHREPLGQGSPDLLGPREPLITIDAVSGALEERLVRPRLLRTADPVDTANESRTAKQQQQRTEHKKRGSSDLTARLRRPADPLRNEESQGPPSAAPRPEFGHRRHPLHAQTRARSRKIPTRRTRMFALPTSPPNTPSFGSPRAAARRLLT